MAFGVLRPGLRGVVPLGLLASTMRWCSGQRKSGMTRRPSRYRGTLTCGGARPAAGSRSWTRSSSCCGWRAGWCSGRGRSARGRGAARRGRAGGPGAAGSSGVSDCARLVIRASARSSSRGAMSSSSRSGRSWGCRGSSRCSSGCRLRVRCTTNRSTWHLLVGDGDLGQAILHGQQPEQHHQAEWLSSPSRPARLDGREPSTLGRSGRCGRPRRRRGGCGELARGDACADLGAGEAAGEQLTEAQHPEGLGRRRATTCPVWVVDDPDFHTHPASQPRHENSTRCDDSGRLRAPTSPSA